MKQVTYTQLKKFLTENAIDDKFNDFIKFRDKAPQYNYWANEPHSRNEGKVLSAIDYAQKHNMFYALGTHEDWQDKKSFIYANWRQSKVEAYIVDSYKVAATQLNPFFYEKVEIFNPSGKLVKTINADEYIKLPDFDEEDNYEVVDPLDDRYELSEPVAEPNEYFYGNGKRKGDDI